MRHRRSGGVSRCASRRSTKYTFLPPLFSTRGRRSASPLLPGSRAGSARRGSEVEALHQQLEKRWVKAGV
eukprot:365520-Chlamydomonas_euryale.AAC.10